jgi:hypothetical protein
MGFVVAAGCGADVKQSSTFAATSSNPSNSDVADQPLVVRLANDGEFPSDPPPAEGRRRLARMDCEKSGRPMDAYYAPVVAFVREHLIGNEHGTVHEALVTTGARMTLGDGLGARRA